MQDPNAICRDDFILQSQMAQGAEAESSAVDNDRLSQLRRRHSSNAG